MSNIVEKTHKSTNAKRCTRMRMLIDQIEKLNSAEQLALSPIVAALREFQQKKADALGRLREMALDEGVNPDFLKISVDNDTLEIKTVERAPEEKAEEETEAPEKPQE